MSFATLFRGCNAPGGCGPIARTVLGSVQESTDAGGGANMLAWLAAFDFDNFATLEDPSTPTSLAWGSMYQGTFSTPALTSPDSDSLGGEGGAGSGVDVAGLFDSQNYVETDGTNYVFFGTRTQVYVPAGSPYFVVLLIIGGAFYLGCAGVADGCQYIELPTPPLEGTDYTIYQLGVADSTFGQTNLTNWITSYVSTMTSQAAYSGTTPPTYGPSYSATATCESGEGDPFTGGDP